MAMSEQQLNYVSQRGLSWRDKADVARQVLRMKKESSEVTVSYIHPHPKAQRETVMHSGDECECFHCMSVAAGMREDFGW